MIIPAKSYFSGFESGLALLFSLLFYQPNLAGQNYYEDSLQIEVFIESSFCPEYSQKKSLDINLEDKIIQQHLMKKIAYSCFTNYEEIFPIYNFLHQLLNYIDTKMICRNLDPNSSDLIFYYELLKSKIKEDYTISPKEHNYYLDFCSDLSTEQREQIENYLKNY